MNTKMISLMTKVVSIIFHPEIYSLHKELNQLYEEQYARTGSPNFIYKGKDFINKNYKDMPIKPVARELRDKLKTYNNAIKELDSNMSRVSSYLNHSNPKNNADIFFLLPQCCHYLLEQYLVNGTPTLKDKPKEYDEIQELIEQSLLLRMIE